MSSDPTPVRKPISKRLRFEVLRRDNHQCRYCGGTAPDVKLTVDHVIPVTLGGSDDPSNLVAACRDCNAGKGSVSPGSAVVDDVRADAFRWAAAIRHAAEIEEGHRIQREETLEWFSRLWDQWTDSNDRPLPRPQDWPNAVENWLNLGLDETDFRFGIDLAMNKGNLPLRDVWRYFCGVMWRTLDRRQHVAQQLLDSGQF